MNGSARMRVTVQPIDFQVSRKSRIISDHLTMGSRLRGNDGEKESRAHAEAPANKQFDMLQRSGHTIELFAREPLGALQKGDIEEHGMKTSLQSLSLA